MNSGTNHHSIVQYRGNWYIFYHNADLYFSNHPEEVKPKFGWGHQGSPHPFRRSICCDRLYYNEDGSIKPVILLGRGPFKNEFTVNLENNIINQPLAVWPIAARKGHTTSATTNVLPPIKIMSSRWEACFGGGQRFGYRWVGFAGELKIGRPSSSVVFRPSHGASKLW